MSAWGAFEWGGSPPTRGAVRAEEPAPAAVDRDALPRLMPVTSIAYFEVADPQPLLAYALDPSWESLLTNVDELRATLESPGLISLRETVQRLEQQSGVSWREALQRSSGEAALAFDPLSQAVLIAIRLRDVDLVEQWRQGWIASLETQAREAGTELPVRSEDYAGVQVYALDGGGYHVISQGTLLISNKATAIKHAIDRQQGRTAVSLLRGSDFAKARAMAAEGSAPQAWGMLRLAAFRLAPGYMKGIEVQRDNPAAEYLLGGLFEALRQADLASLRLDVSDGQLRWQARVPFSPERVSERRKWHFPGIGPSASEDSARENSAPAGSVPLLRPVGTIASVSLYRNLATMWKLRDELFDEPTAARLAQADSQLSLFFAGQNFADDVLSQLTPQWRLLVLQNEIAEGEPTPAVRLPAMAAVFEMRSPDAFAPKLLLGYQRLVGIVNLAAIEQRQPSLLMGQEQRGDVTIHSARYLPEPGLAPGEATVHYNFSPSCARVGRHFVIGSTLGAVRQTLDALQAAEAGSGDHLGSGIDQTGIYLDLAEGAKALEKNRELLITQNMLEKGTSHEEAERGIGLLLNVLSRLKQAALYVRSQGDHITLEFSAGPATAPLE